MLQATLQVLTNCSFSFLHNEVALKFIDDICSCCNVTFVCGYFKQEAQLCILGLDAAGKTTVYRLVQDEAWQKGINNSNDWVQHDDPDDWVQH